MSRYARQIILPEIGEAGQGKLSQARVLVIGAGGLAAPVLPGLAGAGVGHIRIVDPDIVERSNLHRQTLFTEVDCGSSKAEIASGRCMAINSEITAEPLALALTPANAEALVANADIILDCADSYAASFILSDTCLAQRKPLISASVLELSGYVGGFCGGAPSMRAVFPDAPERGKTCATAGVLGSVVATIGAMQAHMALAVLLGLAPSPLGQMVQFDGRTFRTNSFRFENAPEPANPLHFEDTSALSKQDLIIDLRSAEEAPDPAHPDAIRILPPDVPDQLPDAGKKRLALCCASGLRAWQLGENLQPNWPGEIVLVAASTT